jgi:hypothetical protein
MAGLGKRLCGIRLLDEWRLRAVRYRVRSENTVAIAAPPQVGVEPSYRSAAAFCNSSLTAVKIGSFTELSYS